MARITLNGSAGRSCMLSLGRSTVAEAAVALDVPSFDALELLSEDQFRYIGKSNVPIHDPHDITTGKAGDPVLFAPLGGLAVVAAST